MLNVKYQWRPVARFVLTVMATLIVLFAGTLPSATAAEKDTEQAAVGKLVAAFIEAERNFDVPAMRVLMADDYRGQV